MDRRAVRSRTAAVAYIPVLHRGYLDFFRRHRDISFFYVFDAALIAEFDYLKKEIRALSPHEAVEALRSFFPDTGIVSAGPSILRSLTAGGYHVVMPDEDVCRQTARRYLFGCQVTFDPTFLRWDRTNTVAQSSPSPTRVISDSALARVLMGRAAAEAVRSSDWWRQVGALLVRDGSVIVTAHNRHLPTDYTPYIDGDPRNAFFRGINIELGTALHAETGLICECARRGVPVAGAELYVTTFPCPPCAKAIAASGIRRMYYRDGYAMLDGERVLNDAGVEIVLVAE